ncbi:MAG: NAD-dependent epimerase/dehydratase family protein [Actinobacteria bacterium]|nr:NAD-dependent epimerase/dehydratase family protein [Actinomycetota bacterium]
MGRRVLVTGLGTFWGGRLAQRLEADPGVDVIIGLDRVDPMVKLERTEFVRSDENYSILSRIVSATRVDTIVHSFLVVDSTQMSSRTLHEINVIGTMNLFAAASSPASTVRDVVVKSSALVYGASSKDPVWVTEDHSRRTTPRTAVERSLVEVEGYVRDFAVDNPHVTVSMLRFSNVIGPDISTPITKALELPLVPSIAGFDPRIQFVHEDDVLRSMMFVLDEQVPGVFNVAGDGLLPWSEVAALCGKRRLPLPFIGDRMAAGSLRRLGVDLPPELLDLLRYGRGIDSRRLRQTGFRYEYTSAGAVEAFVKAERLRASIGGREPAYEYRDDVEAFFKHSPAVVRDRGR